MPRLTLEQMKKNIAAMREQNADEDIIDRYISVEGFPQGMQEKIDKTVEFENSKLGRIMGITDKITGFLPQIMGFQGPTIKASEQYKKLFADDLKGKSRFKELIKSTGKEALRAGGAAAGLALGGVGPQTAVKSLAIPGKKAIIQGGKQLLQRGLVQGAIQGAAGTVRALGEGESFEDAKTTGTVEGALNLVSVLGEPAVKKLIKEGTKAIIKTGSNVRNFAVEAAMKDPSIITESQPSIVEVGKNISNTMGEFAKKTKDAYSQLLDRLKIPDGLAIDASDMRKVISENNIPRDDLQRLLKSARSRELMDIDESTIIRFTNGGDLSFDEAKKINSLLFDITNTGKIDQLGSGAIGRLRKIKKSFLTILDNQVKGIKKINKFYAKQTDFYDKLSGDFIKRGGDIQEGTLNTVGQRMAGKGTAGRAKGQTIDRLNRLDKIMGTENGKQLVKSLASEEFDRTSMTNLMDYIKLSTGAGLGATLGGPGGAIVGSALSVAAGSPEVTKRAILGSRAISSGLNAAGDAVKIPLRIGVSQQAQKKLFRRKVK